ncbi:MAG: zinc-binding dehydrogenase [Armatimonadota bacterium]|nr:zinc-binding dehydrogenase [Armatimonadota bacterium]
MATVEGRTTVATGVMRQAVLRGPRALELVETPIPQPRPGEVVVRIRAALTCGTDLKTYRRGHPRIAFGPFGHEASGDVASLGDGVDGLSVGQPVAFVPTAGCGQCGDCRRGRSNLCQSLFDDIALGAYGDFLRLPSRVVRQHLFPKPAHLSYLEAAFLEPLACVVHGWSRLGPMERGLVAVVGLGPIGLLHVYEARRRGLQVIAVGRRPGGLALARRAGAHQVVDATEGDMARMLHALGGQEPDVVIECTGTADVWRSAPHWVAPGGRVLLFGGLAAGTEPAFDATRLHYSEVDLISAFHYRTPDVHEALHLLDSGAIRPADLITGLRSLDGIREVFSDLDRGTGLKYAVLPDGEAWR